MFRLVKQPEFEPEEAAVVFAGAGAGAGAATAGSATAAKAKAKANANAVPETILQRILVLPRDRESRDHLQTRFKGALVKNTNTITTDPTSDDSFLDFFVDSIAQELKYVLNSKASDLTPEKVAEFFFLEQSHNAHYIHALNAILERRGTRKDLLKSYVDASTLVLNETINTLVRGYIRYFDPNPTFLFLYYRNGVTPVYSGHIFVQIQSDRLLFISIYKSLFETSTGLSQRILDDVETFARGNGIRTLYTIPLENMVPILEKRGFRAGSLGTYTKSLSSTGGHRKTRKTKRGSLRKRRLRR